MPEQRTNVLGVTQTKWVRPPRPVHGSAQLPPPPPPTAPPAKTLRGALYDHATNKLLGFVLGPAENDGRGTALVREFLQSKLDALPGRTTSALARGYEAAVSWGERTLPRTEFGRFSDRMRTDLTAKLDDYDPEAPGTRAQEAIERYAAKLWATAREFMAARRRARSLPPKPKHAPTVHLRAEGESLEEFFDRVEAIEPTEADLEQVHAEQPFGINELFAAAAEKQASRR